jgi:hypothetical protein
MYLTDIQHDIILGVPWCSTHRVQIDWDALILKIGTSRIPFITTTSKPQTNHIPLVSANQFSTLLQEPDVQIHCILVNQFVANTPTGEPILAEIKELLAEYQDRFPEPLPGVKFANLPKGVPPAEDPMTTAYHSLMKPLPLSSANQDVSWRTNCGCSRNASRT